MDPGCKQHSQLDKIFWSLTNNTRHVRSELIHVSSVSGLSSSAEAGVCLGWRTQATPSLFLCLIQVKQQVLNCCLDSHVDVFASPRLTVSSRDTVQRWVKAELQPLHHLSNFWQRMHITRGERNYTDKEKKSICWPVEVDRGRVCLERPTFKDGHSSFTGQKRQEHFPITVI